MKDNQHNTKKLLDFIKAKYDGKELDNNSLLQIIELSGSLLELQTLPQWAKKNDKSYNGAKMQKNKIPLNHRLFK
jgi:hypothetical protein